MEMHLLHIGMPKAASTFLQNRVFLNCNKTRKFVTSYESRLPKYLDFINDLSISYDTAKNLNPEQCVYENSRVLIKAKEEAKVNLAKMPHLVSSEGLVGSALNPTLNAELIASFLAEVAPNSKILIVIRRQLDYATSIYRQLFQVQDNSNKINFQDLYGLDNNAKINFRSLDWNSLVTSYIRFFGRPNVLVLPFELLLENQLGFLQALRVHLELEFDPYLLSKVPPEDPNKLNLGKFLRTVELNRRKPRSILSQTLKQVRVHRMRKLPKISLSEKDQREFLEAISFSNKQLQTQVHYDLRKFGYFDF